ncbi:helix-turn-helix domain-containing protein [Streptomyces anulatus]|uniref:helix-turn-helix domain-containing protein n=1 Tax=Streptomyces anulatus TaxID=1892 RepID=UPI001C270927|nr:helix-turn-helix domain-containing protein [Streptomyces anulatus]
MPRLTTPPAPAPAAPAVQGRAQWLAQSDCRIAPDACSWLQAVHWFHDHGPRALGRTHGPSRVGSTTLRLAVILARLKECRPGVDTLVGWLKLSERTVQYHLRILREAGLLAYISKGSRVSGVGGRASEFARTVPPLFDDALGLRTGPSELHIRAVHGIDEARRPLMARLVRKARRSLNLKRTKAAKSSSSTAASARSSCTPRGVDTSRSSTTGTTSLPPESNLEDGTSKSIPAEKIRRAEGGPRRLNTVGRRYQLASELVQQLGWLGRAAVPRIAWICRNVADAGWTAAEVIAVVSQDGPPQLVRRPSGFLASRLNGVHRLYDTPAKRRAIVDWWRESRQAARDRHTEWISDWQAPASRAVVRQVNDALTQMNQAETGPGLDALPVGHDGLGDLEQLTRDEIIDLRAAALKDGGLITSTIAVCGETYARRLFTHHLVDQARRLRGTGRLTLHTHREPT